MVSLGRELIRTLYWMQWNKMSYLKGQNAFAAGIILLRSSTAVLSYRNIS